MKKLIINADDYGLTSGVNRAILQLNRAGVLPSTTLMATGVSFAEAAEEGSKQTMLGIGCHVTLVDGTAVLSGKQIPTLSVDGGSGLRQTLSSFARDILRGVITEADIEAEAVAQIQKLQAAGVRVTHLDTHKHTHMFPRVYRPLLRAAATCGVAAIRNPFEPEWSVRATHRAGVVRRLEVRGLRVLRAGFLKTALRAGIATPDGAIGILATGTLDAATLGRFLEVMPEGVWELCCHPGYEDEALGLVRTRLRASRVTEMQALLAVVPPAAHLSLMNFGQLAVSS